MPTTYADKKDVPKTARITLTRELVPDDTEAPDQRDEGFWPSHNAKAAGYCPPELFDASMEAATKRMKAWQAGDWGYVGIRAKASISIPIGQGSTCNYVLESAGLWGVESDSGEEYLNEIYQEQAAELLEHIKQLDGAEVAHA